MIITNVQNPVYSLPDESRIDCVITCEKGTFPFSAIANDGMAYGAQLFLDLKSGKYGPIAPYEEIP